MSKTTKAEAVDRLRRFANGERMQSVWSDSYPPDKIREDLKLVLPPAKEAGHGK